VDVLTILGLALLELERANQLLEMLAGVPAEGPKRLSVTEDQIKTSLEDFLA
jgi:hypothetical protein